MADNEQLDKDAYERSRARSRVFNFIPSIYVHIVPVAVTFGILQLSFRNVYWGNADAENQRLKISALQIAAKVHEILILVSLSSMVLHYTHKLMLAPQGLSFGLLEAAYQSGLSANPWTIGNWEALKHMGSRLRSRKQKAEAKDDGGQPTWLLACLVFIFAFLALFVGPASAITLIPQLGWWHREDLIGPLEIWGGYRSTAPSISIYIPTKLFPTEVDGGSLPGPFCVDAAKDINATCPSASVAEVQRSFTIPQPGMARKTWNTTVAFSEKLELQMLYLQSFGLGDNETNYLLYSKAAVTIPNYVLASFASLIRFPTAYGSVRYADGGPFALDLIADNIAPLAPLVGVECLDLRSDVFLRPYRYDPHEPGMDGDFRTATFDIRTVWDENELRASINGTELVWKDMANITKTPVLLAFLRHDRNVTVCTVQSYWTSTSQWVLSASSYNIATNFTFDFAKEEFDIPAYNPYSTYGYSKSRNSRRIHIHEDWANALNAINGSVKALDALLGYGITTIKENSRHKNSNSTSGMYDYLEATVAQLLAKSVANGLSRIGAQYAADRFENHNTQQINSVSINELTICNERTRWCSTGPWIKTYHMPLAVVANSTRQDVANELHDSWNREDTT